MKPIIIAVIIIIIIIIIIIPGKFFLLVSWSLSDSKSPHVTRTLLSILTDLHNVVVWMNSIFHLISNSSGPFFKPLWKSPSAPITFGITVTLMLSSCLI